MKKTLYIRSITVITILTMLIMLLPDMNQMMKQAALKNKKTPWKYSGQSYMRNISAEELANLYTKRGFMDNAMLSASTTNDYKSHEVAEMIDKALRDDNLKCIKEYFTFLAEVDEITYYSKDRILALVDGNIIVLSVITISFFDTSTIIFEEKSSLLITCSIPVDKNANDPQALSENLYAYYSDTLGLSEVSFYIDQWDYSDEEVFVQAELREFDTDETVIEND